MIKSCHGLEKSQIPRRNKCKSLLEDKLSKKVSIFNTHTHTHKENPQEKGAFSQKKPYKYTRKEDTMNDNCISPSKDEVLEFSDIKYHLIMFYTI